MKIKNILLINHYAGSNNMGMEFRPYYLAREWIKMGYRVRIIAADYSHLRRNNPLVENDLEVHVIDDIEYQWIKTKKYEGNGINRAITMYQFCSKLMINAKEISKQFCPDVVISSSTYPLDNYAARKIAKYNRACVIHEIHDMWPITPMELYGMSKFHPFVVIMGIGEKSFCKHSDMVVSILPCSKNYLVEHGMKPEKFIHIPNGIYLEDWDNSEELDIEIRNIIHSAKESGKTVICFFGSHTRSYSLDYLLKALVEYPKDNVFVLFVGDGNYKQELIKLAQSLNIDENKYLFVNSINKKQIPSLLKYIDASYVGAIKNDMFRFGIGMNKLYDAMMGAKPIIYAVEAPNNIIEECNCGISVKAEDVNSLVLGIEKLVSLSESERILLGENGREEILKNYTYNVIARKFIESMEKIK